MALTLSLRFPAGRYVAAMPNDRESVEWPPHPARLCLGLLDALHRAGNPDNERKALLWLCEQGAPEIALPPPDRAVEQLIEGVFVPQNPSAADGSLKHPRKSRSFPVVNLDTELPSVFFHWPDAQPTDFERDSLSQLVSRLPRLGHSSSLVVANLDDAPDPKLEWRFFEPVETNHHTTPGHQLRVPWPGLVESAEANFDAAGRSEEMARLIQQAKKKAKPTTTLKPAASPRPRHDPAHRWQGYVESPGTEIAAGPWSRDLLMLQQVDGNRLGVGSTWQITEVLHKTLLELWSRDNSRGPLPPWISGHAADSNAPAEHTHLAMFPLPFVGKPYADGHLLGLALALPRAELLGISQEVFQMEWRNALSALFNEQNQLQLTAGDHSWSVTMEPVSSPSPGLTLRPDRWTRSTRHWTSVTPIILHRHPKPHFKKDPVAWKASCRTILRDACAQLDLPEVTSVEPSLASHLAGVPSSREFSAPRPRAGRPPRFHLHARIEFAEAVSGPLLVGAGRYRGYGLLLPDEDADHLEADQA